MSEHNCIMETKIDRLDLKVDKILNSLTGDELGNYGVIPKQKQHDKRIAELEYSRMKNKTIERFIIAAVSFAGSALGILSFFLFS